MNTKITDFIQRILRKVTKKGMTPHDEFYSVYEPLRKKHGLTCHISGTLLSPDEDYIEVFEGAGSNKKLIFKERGELNDCYRQAAISLGKYKEFKRKVQ